MDTIPLVQRPDTMFPPISENVTTILLLSNEIKRNLPLNTVSTNS
jgi:hypothetical protein